MERSGWHSHEFGIRNSEFGIRNFATLPHLDNTNPVPIENRHHQICVISTEGPNGPSGEICGVSRQPASAPNP